MEVSRALLLAGADANATDHNSFSPLYLASQNGHTQLVLDLLAAGADASVKTSRVRTRKEEKNQEGVRFNVDAESF